MSFVKRTSRSCLVPTSDIQFHEGAAEEYEAAFEMVSSTEPERALEFDAEFHRAVGEIRRAPRRWASGIDNTRRFLLRCFPFVVIYRERTPELVQVLAIAHTSRRPGYWRGRT